MTDRLKNIKINSKESITVEFFYQNCKDRFKLTLVSPEGMGFAKLIKDKDIHRPGLALAGYVGLFTFSRIQIFGNTEINFLKHLTKGDRRKSLDRFFSFEIPVIIITDNNEVMPELLEIATAREIPVITTPHPTTSLAFFVNDFLDDQFSQQAFLHGSFVDVYGIGMLFIGKSGVGKSEVVLDLIERGHRLVADDLVIATKKGEGVLMGSGTALGGHFMEIRGLGIIDVRNMFGIRAVRYQKRIEVVVELEDWDKDKPYDRTGLDHSIVNIMGIEIDYINLPILPGKNITVIAEVIALNYLSRHYGYDAPKEFQRKQAENIKRNAITGGKPDRTIQYFEHDFE